MSQEGSAAEEAAVVAAEYQSWMDAMYRAAGASRPGGNAARVGHISIEDFTANYKVASFLRHGTATPRLFSEDFTANYNQLWFLTYNHSLVCTWSSQYTQSILGFPTLTK